MRDKVVMEHIKYREQSVIVMEVTEKLVKEEERSAELYVSVT